MKKLLLILALAGLNFLNADAQTGRRCATYDYYERDLAADPQVLINRNQLELFTQQYILNNPPTANRTSRTISYVIPVVFHILHNYGPEDISDEQCIEAINILNRDYQRLNPDTDLVIPPFKHLVADCEIEFRLANLDPDGFCTTGIEHIPTLKTYSANNFSKLNPWPNNRYLNIWVAHDLENQGAAAYAHMPGSVSDLVDGIMCWYLYAGGTGTSNPNNSRTLTHEIGHHFNLHHTWNTLQSNPGLACGDDGVGDTPETKGFDNCSDLYASICNPPVIENVQNYMEYSYCDVMFTAGQKARMHACLNSSAAHRDTLWSAYTHQVTGIDILNPPVCSPVADFSVQNPVSCQNTGINFVNHSWKGKPTSWTWYFPGGTPSISNDTNPTNIIYPNAGSYEVKLVVSNANGSDSITKTDIVRIGSTVPVNVIPYAESFTDPASFPGAEGWITNQDGLMTWERVATVGRTDTACIRINNITNAAGNIDEWITPSFDFTNVSSQATISFWVANAQRNTQSADVLSLQYSFTNCGQSWSSAGYVRAGATLATAPITTSFFTPTSTQWRRENVIVNGANGKANVRFRFTNTSDHGNNTYIDDINITGIYVNVDEVDELQAGFAMYPNPAKETTTISYMLAKTSDVKIEVKDILGRLVSTAFSGSESAGANEHTISSLTSGVYLVDLVVNTRHHVRRLVVE